VNTKLSFINKLLNISSDQWPRISISWLIFFFIKVSYIVGWTIIISIFVSHYGILTLPILLVINSSLIILGSRIFSKLIHHFKKENLIISTTLLCGFLLILSTFFAEKSWEIFFTIVLVAEAILLSQLRIINSIFTEELFTPLESEQTFPIIESSETVGGIVGGLLIISLINVISVPQFIYIWTLVIILCIPTVLIFKKYHEDIPDFEIANKRREKNEIQKTTYAKKFRKAISNIKKIPFLQTILIIVLLEGIFFNILEFQYTQAVDSSVVTGSEVSHSAGLAKSLGLLHIVFSIGALATQLFITSRIIQMIGISKSILLNPLVNMLSLIGLTFRFGLTTAVITRTNFEITHNVYLNAYHSSYYAIKPEKRENIKEFLEGTIKPLGLIIGTLLIFLAQYFFKETKLTDALNLIMVTVTAFTIYYAIKLQRKYTYTAKKNLNSDEIQRKLDAAEILGQKGHKNAAEILANHLSDPDEVKEVKIQILKVLAKIRSPKALPEILETLENKDDDLKYYALLCLQSYKNLGKHVFSQAFSRYRVINTLRNLFEEDQPERIKSAAIKILANLNASEIIPFLLKLLKSQNDTIRADCIYICGLFRDQNATHYIKPYLDDPSLRVRCNAIIALWQFKKYRAELKKKVDKMLNNSDSKVIRAGIFVAGEINLKSEKRRIYKLISSENPKIKLHAAIALTKMGYKLGIDTIVNLLLNEDDLLSNKCKQLIFSINNKHRDTIFKLLKLKISKLISTILKNIKHDEIDELPKETLRKLKWAYEKIDRDIEVAKINELIKNQSNK